MSREGIQICGDLADRWSMTFCLTDLPHSCGMMMVLGEDGVMMKQVLDGDFDGNTTDGRSVPACNSQLEVPTCNDRRSSTAKSAGA